MPDLTTLNAVKAWLNVSSNQDDQLLSGLISQVSAVILSYLGRGDILKRQYLEPFTGIGQASKPLRNYPVLSVASVSTGRLAVPAGDGVGIGYWVDPDEGFPPGRMQLVHLNGFRFERTLCKIVYEAGYAISGEQQTAATTIIALAPNGSWARDDGVTYANGTPLTPVATNPSVGQYAMNPRIPGQYIFSTADAGAQVLLNYSYIPDVLEQACIETVAERYRYKNRIGQVSESANGMTTSTFSLKDMQDYVKLSLQPFRRVVPV